jgi:hypothetical protein
LEYQYSPKSTASQCCIITVKFYLCPIFYEVRIKNSFIHVTGSTGDMSAHTINELATWMIEHPCIDSEVLDGREDDSGHSSGSEIPLSRAQVIHSA